MLWFEVASFDNGLEYLVKRGFPIIVHQMINCISSILILSIHISPMVHKHLEEFVIDLFVITSQHNGCRAIFNFLSDIITLRQQVFDNLRTVFAIISIAYLHEVCKESQSAAS